MPNLMSVRLPPNDSLVMGDCVFADCTELATLTISNSATQIESCFLSQCKQLQEIHFERKDLKSVRWDDEILEGLDKERCMIFVPKGTKEKYKVHLPSKASRLWRKAKGVLYATLPNKCLSVPRERPRAKYAAHGPPPRKCRPPQESEFPSRPYLPA